MISGKVSRRERACLFCLFFGRICFAMLCVCVSWSRQGERLVFVVQATPSLTPHERYARFLLSSTVLSTPLVSCPRSIVGLRSRVSDAKLTQVHGVSLFRRSSVEASYPDSPNLSLFPPVLLSRPTPTCSASLSASRPCSSRWPSQRSLSPCCKNSISPQLCTPRRNIWYLHCPTGGSTGPAVRQWLEPRPAC